MAVAAQAAAAVTACRMVAYRPATTRGRYGRPAFKPIWQSLGTSSFWRERLRFASVVLIKRSS